MGKRFMLADDHSVVRAGVSTLLKSTYAKAIVDETTNGAGVQEALKKHHYDLIILDINMPDTDTPSLIKYITTHYPSIPVLVFSMSPEQVYALRVLKAGAKGFVSKESSLEELRVAIDLVLKEKTYISPGIIQLMADQSLFNSKETPFASLSPREFQIATILLEGKSISEIAASLNIQKTTASTHKARLFTKLNVKTLLELKELSVFHKF
jgi:two-component system, NarL family, invasion response regulator UvrY